MALPETQQNPWDDWLNSGGNTGIGNTGHGDPGPLAPAPSSFDLNAFYQNTLGRAPDANEMATDTQNIAKYGADAFQSDFLSKRPNNQPGSGTYAPAQPTTQRLNVPGLQFDDAYSNLLEQIAQRQLGEVRQSPALDSLMQFLTQQFQDLSTNPGYGPQEQALLNTQAFEPIEANRAASKQRATERAAARGFAPSSGLMELDLRDIERAADQARTVAGRDLAIAGLDRRDKDLSRALDIGQLQALTIPRAQRGEEVALGNLLYQLPRTALQDAFSQAIQLLTQQYAQQGRADANNATLYGSIGDILAQLFR